MINIFLMWLLTLWMLVFYVQLRQHLKPEKRADVLVSIMAAAGVVSGLRMLLSGLTIN